MSQYLLSVFHEPGVHAAGTAYEDTEAMRDAMERVAAFNDELVAGGRMAFACGLTEPEAAVQVDGEGAVTEGPRVTDAAQLGGFWVVEAESDDEALEIARRGSAACGQRLEVRKLQG